LVEDPAEAEDRNTHASDVKTIADAARDVVAKAKAAAARACEKQHAVAARESAEKTPIAARQEEEARSG